MTIQLTGLYQYPIKSIAGLSLNRTSVEPFGLAGDRCMMLVDAQGKFISQRKHPQLAMIKINQLQQALSLKHASVGELQLDASVFTKNQKEVEVWGDLCKAFVANEQTNQWFSRYLNQTVYLVQYDFNQPRKSDIKYSQQGDVVSFADGFPILLISKSSLNDLNSRLDKPVSMQNFRPNIVIDGCDAFAEDEWKKIKIGDLTFDLVKQCSRCVLTTVDPSTGKKNQEGQPLRTLSKYRRNQNGVMFGMNLIARDIGEISIGDLVQVIR